MGFEDAGNSRGLQYNSVLPAPPPRHETAPQEGWPDSRKVTTGEEDTFGCEIVNIEEAPDNQVREMPYEQGIEEY